MNPNVNVTLIPFDVGNIEQIPSVVHSIYEKFGRIDCLMNIAGYTNPQSLFETTTDNLYTTFAVNVYAPFLLSKECAGYMKQNEEVSKIINIASTSGCTPRPGWSVYAMSKSSIIEMSVTLSEELAPYGIKVYCLSPGRCATDLRRKLAPEEDQSKIMQPQDVGAEIARMASKNETCLDGQNIIVRKKF
ncbi:MAG: SDR family oxidoreductase [Clostridia bacterium]|nr:SDR family oxidoreductase [Clostridia bacterium]